MDAIVERLAEDVAYARSRQRLIDRDLHGPFPWMLKTDQEVLRDRAREMLLAAGFSEADVDQLLEWEW